ncbi:hypothetical protein DPMN_072938 [Dreissena polymorpha]|uniref:Uncharacterized protein n=1 Tax=Dreissena polymorpha TaxID=45954 RepID=A0A9D4BY85_DREPO|nr:hypothetical protein DPMN_072938 [Dreissena polymorpha]
MIQLEVALNAIKNAAELGAFSVQLQDDRYELDLNQTKLAGDGDCLDGHTRVSYYCGMCFRKVSFFM